MLQRSDVVYCTFQKEFSSCREMSPASKSKPKDKKASKEVQKPAPRSTGPAAAGSSGVPATAYNPLSGTFHALEPTVSVSSPLHSSDRFRNIDDTDAQSGVLLSSVAEYDTVSNTGSWSGESEDHKDKRSNPTVRPETIPGADIDKREKTRLKNEKKHQRQKERRAQELQERCTGYLMSRKLDALAQQLVSMGFSQDRATVALMLNEGNIEESVAWLLEGGEEADDPVNQDLGGHNLKLDISEELARIADLEAHYKCTKQEVERAVVASEGDLEKAAESLRELKLDPPPAAAAAPPPPPKPEKTVDPPTALSSKFPGNTNQALRPQANLNPHSIQQRKEEKDFNYTKGAITAGMSIAKNIPQPPRRSQPKMEWGNYEQITTDKRWSSAGTSPVSFSLASPPSQLSSPPSRNETRSLTTGTEFSSLQSGPAREPSSVVQGRNPSLLTKPASVGTISSSPPAGRYSTSSSGFMPQIRSSTSFKASDMTSNQMYPQVQYQQQQQQQQRHFIPEATHSTAPWSRTGASSPIAPATSLGLFSGASSTQSGLTSPIDWNTGCSMPNLDYTDIDWSVDRSSARPGGLLQGLNSSYVPNNPHIYESNTSRLVDARPFGQSGTSNFNRDPTGGATETSANSSREWTSPFEGNDIFSFPRQFVYSPPLEEKKFYDNKPN